MSEERFRDFAQTASDSIWELDADLSFTFLSEEAKAYYDRLNIQFLGKKPWDVFDTELAPDNWARIIEALERREAFRNLDYCFLMPNGTMRNIRVSGKPIFDEAGTFKGYRGTTSDTTELRRADQRLRDAIESIPDAFVLWDAEDRLALCNEHYREFYPTVRDLLKPGIKFEDLMRRSVELGQYQIEGDMEEWIARRLDQHRRAEDLVEQQLSDGRWLLVSERHTVDGGIVGVRSDITARKIAEKSLRDRESQLRSLVENLPGFIFRRRMGREGDFSYDFVSGRGMNSLNDRYAAEIQNDPEKLKSILHPEDR